MEYFCATSISPKVLRGTGGNPGLRRNVSETTPLLAFWWLTWLYLREARAPQG